MKLATLFLSGALLAGVVFGCAAQTKAKEEKLCTPGSYVFCRCQDRQEGAKLCNEDGNTFGKCEPCETATNPEIDPGNTSSSGGSSGDPFTESDAGDSGPSQGNCGDGVVQSGEDCDDKNTNDTDGCDTHCKLAGVNPAATNNCPGLEVHVWGGAHKPTTVGSTSGAGNRSSSPTCTGQTGNSTSGAAAADRVFKVVAHKTGVLNVVTSDTDFNNFLWAAADGKCTASAVEQLACKNSSNTVGGETLTVPVEAGKAYQVFVDGAGAGLTGDPPREGSFRVTFQIP